MVEYLDLKRQKLTENFPIIYGVGNNAISVYKKCIEHFHYIKSIEKLIKFSFCRYILLNLCRNLLLKICIVIPNILKIWSFFYVNF